MPSSLPGGPPPNFLPLRTRKEQEGKDKAALLDYFVEWKEVVPSPVLLRVKALFQATSCPALIMHQKRKCRDM